MTDERNPSDDVLDAIHEGLLEDLVIDLDPDLNRSGLRFAAIDALKALSAAGFVAVRAPGLNHGDELVRRVGPTHECWGRPVEVNND